jgi:hypothetical protein
LPPSFNIRNFAASTIKQSVNQKHMKRLIFTLAMIGTTVISFAQTTTTTTKGGGKFSIGAEIGIPTGNANDVYNLVIGGSLKYEYPVAATTFITLSAGYNSFQPNSPFKDLGLGAAGFIPVKAGLKYYFSEGFFGEGQLGAAFSTQSGGGTAFAYAPGVGYTLKNGLEAGVRYEAWSHDGTIGQAGLRIAYRF